MSISEQLIAALPKSNELPLELLHCNLEVHRKEQDMAPLLNEVRNSTLAEVKQILSRVELDEGKILKTMDNELGIWHLSDHTTPESIIKKQSYINMKQVIKAICQADVIKVKEIGND